MDQTMFFTCPPYCPSIVPMCPPTGQGAQAAANVGHTGWYTFTQPVSAPPQCPTVAAICPPPPANPIANCAYLPWGSPTCALLCNQGAVQQAQQYGPTGWYTCTQPQPVSVPPHCPTVAPVCPPPPNTNYTIPPMCFNTDPRVCNYQGAPAA